MMKALIFDSKVVQIEAAEFPVAPALEWVDITGIMPSPEVGWAYDGNTFSPPPGLSLAGLKADKQQDFVTEGIKHIATQVPDWDSIEMIKTVSGLWVSHLVTSATPAQIKAKDIYLYIRDTVPPKIIAIATAAELAAVDPTVADPFGDGTAWPI